MIERRYSVSIMARRRNGTIYAGVTNHLAARSFPTPQWRRLAVHRKICSEDAGLVRALRQRQRRDRAKKQLGGR